MRYAETNGVYSASKINFPIFISMIYSILPLQICSEHMQSVRAQFIFALQFYRYLNAYFMWKSTYFHS